MSYVNGRLPSSALAPIPGGRLRKDAADAWNAMRAAALRRYQVDLRPLGPNSSYRPLEAQRYFWNLYRSGRGNLAAYPGTSNHGEGIAVDLASKRMRWVIDQIGASYGFAKKWSDAPGEWWHIKFRPGVWKPSKPKTRRPVLRKGASGVWVTRLQNALRRKNVSGAPKPTGFFGPKTKQAVQRFQKKHKLKGDGVVGPRTWDLLVGKE